MKKNLLGVISCVACSLVILASCGPTAKEPTQLDAVSNLSVTRNEDVWNVTFDGVENASKYSLKVFNEELPVFEEEILTTSYSMTPIKETATFVFQVSALGDETLYKASEVTTFNYDVHVYNEEDVNGVKFTGVAEQGKPVSEFTYVYSDGATYVGTVEENFARKHGRLTYPNQMFYEGDFVNDNFEGDGLFSWSTTGNWHDSNAYEGKFIAGGFNDQFGTFYTSANWNFDINYSGLLYFTGQMGPVFGIAGKTGVVGKGGFQYGNNSVYEGDLYVNGDWNYSRHGYGWNKWLVLEASAWVNGGSDSLFIDGFEGMFDKSGWILGDGIWYFKDSDGNPIKYAKGNWEGGVRKGDATSELVLREEYKNATEITF